MGIRFALTQLHRARLKNLLPSHLTPVISRDSFGLKNLKTDKEIAILDLQYVDTIAKFDSLVESFIRGMELQKGIEKLN